tara:strand:- start:39 stop:389 length:351 start_codon:yes stop_codon:yes gene_type:complete
MSKLTFIKGNVSLVGSVGVDVLLTPEDVKNLSTKNGYLALSIREGKDGKPYAFKATKRLAPIRVDVVDEIHDLARISVEEMPHNQLDAVSASVYKNEETVSISDIIAEVNRKYKGV